MTMTLKQLCDTVTVITNHNVSLETVVRGISMDTRRIVDENIFFVNPSPQCAPVFLMEEASKKGVEVFIADEEIRPNVPEDFIRDKRVLFVKDIRGSSLKMADVFYCRPQDALTLVGITGTNGKTTTAYFIFQLLNALGVRAACFGTVRNWISPQAFEDAELTTADFLMLRKLLRRCVDEHVKVVVMEVSSHSLHQGRIEGLQFAYTIFTNLSQDHLDYHKNLASYFDAKSRLFTQYRTHDGKAIINIDDSRGGVLFRIIGGNKISYGLNADASYSMKGIQFGRAQTMGTVVTPSETMTFEYPFFGKHNMYNALGALTVLAHMGIPLADIQQAFKRVLLPPGRMERIEGNIFVDYAHTPDALENSLLSLKAAGYDKLILIFGCGGDRDKKKRPLMGMIASEAAEFTIITSDNPRSENPEVICDEIKQGCVYKKNQCQVIVDRSQALSEGLKLLRENPTAALLVAGKGHEEYQVLPTGKIHFSDREEISKLLNLRGDERSHSQ